MGNQCCTGPNQYELQKGKPEEEKDFQNVSTKVQDAYRG